MVGYVRDGTWSVIFRTLEKGNEWKLMRLKQKFETEMRYLRVLQN